MAEAPHPLRVPWWWLNIAVGNELDLCVQRIGRVHRPLRVLAMNLNDVRSLYYGRWIAERLDDAMLARARARLERWQQSGGIHPVSAQRWHGLLSVGVEAVRDVLIGTDERSQELRTDAPFAGELPVAERNRLFRQARIDYEAGR